MYVFTEKAMHHCVDDFVYCTSSEIAENSKLSDEIVRKYQTN